jgi:uncharacterized protein
VEWLSSFLRLAWSITLESAPWVVLSLLLGGLIHEYLPASRLLNMLSRKGPRAMLGAVAFGALLPICSCGVIPLAVSLYRSGVRIGPVMAFAAATPMINPAAVILSLALLGPALTIAYVLVGLSLPFVVGVVAERWGGSEARAVATVPIGEPPAEVVSYKPSRLVRAVRWGIAELGTSIAFYLAGGVLAAAAIMASVPPGWIDSFLGDGGILGLLVVGVFGAVIYVCAVAHIPVVATLLASGAAPGAAIVFLVTGAATNLPELIALYHAIGRRTVVVYVVGLVVGSLVAGMVVNVMLLPGFEPVFDPLRSLEIMRVGQLLQPTVAGWIATLSGYLLVGLAAWGFVARLRARLRPAAQDVSTTEPSCAKACCCPSESQATAAAETTVRSGTAG